MSEELVGCPVIECRQEQKNHHHKPSESVRFHRVDKMNQYIFIHERRYHCCCKHQNEAGANGQQGGRLAENSASQSKEGMGKERQREQDHTHRKSLSQHAGAIAYYKVRTVQIIIQEQLFKSLAYERALRCTANGK